MKSVLLYSGGMDSWLIDKLEKPDVKLFIDINTASSNAEIMRLPSDVIIVPLRDLGRFERSDSDFILPLRNLYFIAIASNYGERIILGATSTDVCCDKTDAFAKKTEDLLNYLWQPQKWTRGKKIKIDLSYRQFSKSQLLSQFIKSGGKWQDAYNQSFSCYTPNNRTECHNCRPCFLKLMAFLDNNLPIPKDIISSYVPYIENKIVEYSNVWGDRLYSKSDYEKVLQLAR